MFSARQCLELFYHRNLSFIGRSSRGEFGWVLLCYIALNRSSIIIVSLFLHPFFDDINDLYELYDFVWWVLYCIFVTPVVVRRLHDRDIPAGFAIFFIFPAPAGLLPCAVLWMMPGQLMSNRYGINPIFDPVGHYDYYTSRCHIKYKAAYGCRPKL